VTVANIPKYTAQTLAFPSQPLRIMSMVYDAERGALLVAAGFSQPGSNQLWRYTYAGGAWSPSPKIVSVPDLRGIAFTADNSHLLVLTSFAIDQYDAANPAAGSLKTIGSISASTAQRAPFFKMLALANDGNIILAAGAAGTNGFQKAFLYSPGSGTIAPFTNFFAGLQSSGDSNDSTIVASADGSHVFGTESGFTDGQPVLAYTTAKQTFAQTTVSANQLSQQPAALDSSVNRLAVNSGTAAGIQVYDSSYKLIGAIPAARHLLLNPQGTRAYTFTDTHFLMTYDISAPAAGGGFSQVGAAIPQSLPSQSDFPAVLSAISPDGGTIFLVSDGGVAIVPAPQ
jgi:hypothetical protein